MENYILIAILVAIAAGAVRYLVRAKKRGQACVGCPHAKKCGGCCSGSCSDKNRYTRKNNDSSST